MRVMKILAIGFGGFVAFSIYLATAAYDGAELLKVFPHSFGLAYPLPFLFGPLVSPGLRSRSYWARTGTAG